MRFECVSRGATALAFRASADDRLCFLAAAARSIAPAASPFTFLRISPPLRPQNRRDCFPLFESLSLKCFYPRLFIVCFVRGPLSLGSFLECRCCAQISNIVAAFEPNGNERSVGRFASCAIAGVRQRGRRSNYSPTPRAAFPSFRSCTDRGSICQPLPSRRARITTAADDSSPAFLIGRLKIRETDEKSAEIANRWA